MHIYKYTREHDTHKTRYMSAAGFILHLLCIHSQHCYKIQFIYIHITQYNIYIYTHTYMYSHIYVHTLSLTLMHIHTHTHAHTHTHTHTDTRRGKVLTTGRCTCEHRRLTPGARELNMGLLVL